MTKKQETILFLLMSINAIAFVVIFLLVAYQYRLAWDDYHYAAMVRELGVWDAMKYYYNNWSPRWSSILVVNSFLTHAKNQSVLFLFHLCSLTFGVLAVSSFTASLKRKLQLPITKPQTVLIGTYVLAIVFYSSFSKADTWFWLTASPMYLWGVLASVLGGSLLLQNWNYRIRYPLIVFVFLYVGGSSESAALFSLTVLLFVGLFLRNSISSIMDRKALHLATISCMIGFGICMVGDGIEVRREHLPSYPAQDRLLVGLWNYVKFNFYEIPKMLPLVVLAVVPFGFFGRKHLRFQLISFRDVFWSNKKLWFLADFCIAILALALGWVMCEMGPHRTWFPITMLVVAVAIALAYQLGSWAYIVSKGHFFKLVVLAQILFLSYQVYEVSVNLPKAVTYAEAHDARSTFLNKTVFDSPISVVPLPQSGWLLSGDISTDPNRFTNKHLGLFFKSEYPIIADSTLTSFQ